MSKNGVAIPPMTEARDGAAGASLPRLSRRSFLETVGVGAALVTVGGGLAGCGDGAAAAETPAEERRQAARSARNACADLAFNRPLPEHLVNGEEADYPYVANFSKGLPHDDLGEVDPNAYAALLTALESGRKEDFEAIPLAGQRRLRNPQAGLAFDLEGPD